MSKNAKKKKRKGPSLEKQLEEAIANHAAEYKQWYNYWTYGGHDPNWPDGSNMFLIRNPLSIGGERDATAYTFVSRSFAGGFLMPVP